MRRLLAATALIALLSGPALAQAACPNASTTVTIPVFGSGPALVTVCDQLGNVLDATMASVSPGQGLPVLTPTTSPSLVKDAAGLHLSAGGTATGSAPPLACGATGLLTITLAGKSTPLTYYICAQVTGISTGTTTP